jgi:C4-dicarboxylate transporter DctM subunit
MGFFVGIQRISDQIVGALFSISDSEILIQLLLNLNPIGAVMDDLAVMVVSGGLLMKLGTQLGIDSIQLGPIVVINFAAGMGTPPLGYTLFVSKITMTRPGEYR